MDKNDRYGSGLTAFLHNFDMFAAPVPTMNIQGRTEVKTLIGSIASLVIMSFTIMFGFIKLQVMLLRKGSTVIQSVDEAGTGAQWAFNMNDNDFMMAFSASNWKAGARADITYI